MDEAQYNRYIHDFNAACAGDGNGFDKFYDRYFEPGASFEYLPNATKNVGKEMTVAFWKHVHQIMHEEIREHRSFVHSKTSIAVEAPIDFQCKQDLEWVGVQHPAGSSFRLMMCAFYEISRGGKYSSVRVYSIYHPAYQIT